MFDGDLLLWTASTVAVLALSVLLFALTLRVLRRVVRRGEALGRLIVDCRRPARILVGSLAAYVMSFGAPVTDGVREGLKHLLALVIIGAVAWLLVRAGFVLMDLVLQKQHLDVRDNLRARRIRTQITMLRRIMVVVVGVVTAAAMLMTFAEVRAFGASILASAGIIGLVAGVAARPTIENLIAGIQIAFTEPIRFDDVVVVEGEWGRVEEITLTYVVVRIWDQRRLVLPISYFILTPFENWTRSTADLLGSVTLRTDYRVDVDALRRELDRLLRRSDLWDGRTQALQVIDATEQGVELRALMSAPDAPTAWDLRCQVREGLIEFLQRSSPESLPRVRADVRADDLVLAAHR